MPAIKKRKAKISCETLDSIYSTLNFAGTRCWVSNPRNHWHRTDEVTTD